MILRCSWMRLYSLLSLCRRIWWYWISKMLVRYILSRGCLWLSESSQSSLMQWGCVYFTYDGCENKCTFSWYHNQSCICSGKGLRPTCRGKNMSSNQQHVRCVIPRMDSMLIISRYHWVWRFSEISAQTSCWSTTTTSRWHPEYCRLQRCMSGKWRLHCSGLDVGLYVSISFVSIKAMFNHR